MAAIFEEVTITWGTDEDGEPVEYTVTPTYKMVQQIEQRISIAGMAGRIAAGEPPVSHMAEVLSILLRSAGADASPDDVYAELMTTDDTESLGELANVVMTAFIPSKKSDSPSAGKALGGGKKGNTSK